MDDQNRQDLLKKIRFFFRNFNSVVIKPSISRGEEMFLSFQKNINTSKNPNGREVTLSFIEFKNNYLNKLKTYINSVERLFELPLILICYVQGKLLNGISRRRIIPSMPKENL